MALFALAAYLLWLGRDGMVNPTPPPKLTPWERVLDLLLKAALILFFHGLFSVLLLMFG